MRRTVTAEELFATDGTRMATDEDNSDLATDGARMNTDEKS
jgi:hypothetical protein